VQISLFDLYKPLLNAGEVVGDDEIRNRPRDHIGRLVAELADPGADIGDGAVPVNNKEHIIDLLDKIPVFLLGL